MLTWERSVSVSFAQARSYRERAKKKCMIHVIVPGRSSKENEPGTLRNFQGALSTTNGNTDVVARPAGSWNSIRQFSGAWMLAAPRRENLVPRVIGAHYRSEFERPARYVRICRDETLRGRLLACVTSRDFLPRFFFETYVSYPRAIFLRGRLDDNRPVG